jgi:signal transduction histidine kinase
MMPVMGQRLLSVDSAMQKQPDAANLNAYISSCFFIADAYMDEEQYDSAQVWLNKIHELLPAKSSSLHNYFLTTRQAEVYYYNNLQQLGLQESLRGLEMAKELRDSLLLADSYNFLGLFYMNTDSAAGSVNWYKQGIRYTRQPPYGEKYISLTKPHHLYGNLSEAFYKLKAYDSAIAYNNISLQKASAINWKRGMAVAHKTMGDIFLAMNQPDSALQHFSKGMQTALAAGDIDVELLCYSGQAKCTEWQNNHRLAADFLDRGFALLQQNPNLNRFFALQFLTDAAVIYRNRSNYPMLIKTLELKSATETANIKGANKQIQTVLQAGLANEKRLLRLEVAEARQKQKLANSRFVIALIAIALLGIGFLVYRYYQNQKMAIAGIRQKISRDLHDDIGASLSSLQIYSSVAAATFNTQPDKSLEMIHKISVQSKSVMDDMSDIIWSMENKGNQQFSLNDKIKNYGVELLTEKGIECAYHIAPATEEVLKEPQARKNLILIVKEAMNNMAKYSNAKKATISTEINKGHLVLRVTDDGIGFDTDAIISGNGLMNMRRRMEELNGTLAIHAAPGRGTAITAEFPLALVNKPGA